VSCEWIFIILVLNDRSASNDIGDAVSSLDQVVLYYIYAKVVKELKHKKFPHAMHFSSQLDARVKQAHIPGPVDDMHCIYTMFHKSEQRVARFRQRI
jgi:hypothetical protein